MTQPLSAVVSRTVFFNSCMVVPIFGWAVQYSAALCSSCCGFAFLLQAPCSGKPELCRSLYGTCPAWRRAAFRALVLPGALFQTLSFQALALRMAACLYLLYTG